MRVTGFFFVSVGHARAHGQSLYEGVQACAGERYACTRDRQTESHKRKQGLLGLPPGKSRHLQSGLNILHPSTSTYRGYDRGRTKRKLIRRSTRRGGCAGTFGRSMSPSAVMLLMIRFYRVDLSGMEGSWCVCVCV